MDNRSAMIFIVALFQVCVTRFQTFFHLTSVKESSHSPPQSNNKAFIVEKDIQSYSFCNCEIELFKLPPKGDISIVQRSIITMIIFLIIPNLAGAAVQLNVSFPTVVPHQWLMCNLWEYEYNVNNKNPLKYKKISDNDQLSFCKTKTDMEHFF